MDNKDHSKEVLHLVGLSTHGIIILLNGLDESYFFSAVLIQ